MLAQVSPFPDRVLGYRDFSRQAKIDQDFLAVPDTKLAQEELKTLTAAPHVAASKEDYDTAVYVAGKFKAAGLDTQIVPYRAWLNLPQEVYLQAVNAEGKVLMSGPTREHVDDDPYQDDPRVLPAFNGSSPSCDVTADAVYVNYARPEDFKKLEEMHISVAGKIVLARYGMNFRGVKVYLAQQRGAAGVIIYSDPADDGYFQGDKYPHGPWRPDTGVQRGSVQYMFKYPGDATTPDVASTPGLCGDAASAALSDHQPAHHPLDAAFLSRCIAHTGKHGGSGRAAGLAGRAALQLPRGRSGFNQGAHAAQDGLCRTHDMGCDWKNPRQPSFPMSGWSPAITAMRGSSEPSIRAAGPQPCWRRSMASVPCLRKDGSPAAPCSFAAGMPKRKA